MPQSTAIASAVGRIAELAGTSIPAEQKLEQILSVAREALGVDSLWVITKELPTGDVTLWPHSSDTPILNSLSLEKNILGMFDNAGSVNHTDGNFVLPLSSQNGSYAALVGSGKLTPDTGQALLKITAGYVTMLLENTRLSETVETSNLIANRRMQEIATIYEIGQAMDPSDVEPVLDMIVEKASVVMDAQACSLMLRDQRDGALVIEASYGLTDDIIKGARINYGEGIAGRVAATGEPMLISDVASDPRLRESVTPRAGISGSMCVPLRDEDGEVQGVISIRRHEPKPPFNTDDLKLFSVFATHAALALSNAQLYSRLHRKVQEMSTISDVLQAINSTLDLNSVLDQIVENITQLVGFDRCCLYLLDSRTNEYVAGARKGYNTNDQIADRVRVGEGVIGLAAREQIPIFSQGSPLEPDGSESSGEYLVAPVVVRDACIGVVVVDNSVSSRAIEPQHVELLATFVSQAGIAVENARLYEAMEEKYAELNVLYEHSKNISAAYGLDNVAEMLVKTACKAARSDGAGLLIFDTRRGHLKVQASSGGMMLNISEIEQIASEERCIQFIREQHSPMLLSAESRERTQSPNADLLNALAPGHSNLMLAPLVAEDTTIGALALYRNQAEEFQGSEFKLISIITSHAATVIKNAITYEQKMSQRVLELTALYEFSKKISSAASLGEALDSILAIVADLVDYDESFIYAIDHENAVADVKAARFRGKPEAIPPEEPLGGGSVVSWVIDERKALVSPDVGKDPRFQESRAGNRRVRSMMSIPLIVQDDVVGVLSVHSYNPQQYSDDDVRVLSIIASQGAAIYKELEALTALTSYTDNILSSIAAGVVTLDSDGTVLTWNIAAESIVGISREDIVLTNYEDALQSLNITQDDREMLKRAVVSVLETGETYQGYKLCIHPINKDELYINMSISQLLNSAGEQLGLVCIFEDITREIRMEDDVRRMGELAAVGQLAATIAHELRNPLSSIKGAAQFLQKEYENEESIVEFLGIIIEEVNGLNKLTTEFLDFARPMQLEAKPININTVLEKTLHLMSVHITDNNVVIKEKFSDEINEIEADEKQLQQVLKNIIINALQAMPEGGALTLETGPTPSGGIFFSVGDTGIGIPQNKIEKIFQPFITTKTKGTGLGLSVVKKIIENHGGRIEVKSEENHGSTFKIILPKMGMRTAITQEVDDHTMERRMSGELKSGDI